MRVGVIMPTYNQVEFLPEALRSVRDQDYRNFKLVVVNDGSTDKTAEVLQGYPVFTIDHRQNRGTAEAINTGFEALPDVDAVTWVSSDNVMTPDWLSVLVEMLQWGLGVAYGAFMYNAPGKAQRVLFKKHTKEALIETLNCYYGPAFLIRRDVWAKAGCHRGRISHDYDHWLRVEEACWAMGLQIAGSSQPLCLYNAHDKRATVTRASEFDADHWQQLARTRRGL